MKPGRFWQSGRPQIGADAETGETDACFVSAETSDLNRAQEEEAAPSGAPRSTDRGLDRFEAALERCANFNAGSGLFEGDWNDAAVEAKAEAYELYLLVRSDDGAAERVREHPSFLSRKRRPSLKKKALLTLQFTAKPRDQPERKLCSEWTYHLLHAESQQVAADGFADWVRKNNLSDAKKSVRQGRESGNGKAKADEPSDNGGDGGRGEPEAGSIAAPAIPAAAGHSTSTERSSATEKRVGLIIEFDNGSHYSRYSVPGLIRDRVAALLDASDNRPLPELLRQLADLVERGEQAVQQVRSADPNAAEVLF